jgi:peptide/nickel transport system substrate-binding protein
VVDEATTKFAGLVGGELDVAGIAPSMASLVDRDPSLRVLDYPVLVSYGIVFNTHRPPFDDSRVRRALALAIDRRRVVEAALAGFATPADGPIPTDHPYAMAASGETHDMTAAGRLLDEAGWRRDGDGMRRKNNTALRFELLTVGSSDNAAEQLLQADFLALGVRMEIGQREMSAFLSEARARDKRFDALFTGIPGDLSLAYLSAMFDSALAGGALDYGSFHTPALDLLLARARAARSDAEAGERWLDVQRYLDDAMPIAWVYHARGVQGVARRLRGVTMDLRGEMVSIARWEVDRGGSPIALTR